MQQRGIPLDTWAFNTLLQSCSTACDLEAAKRIRGQMRGMGVPPDDITFLHLFCACAKRTKQVAMASKDTDDLDDWDDWTGVGAAGSARGGFSDKQALSHASLTGALVDSSGAAKAPSVGEAARAAAAAAREGLSSVRDIFSEGFGGHDEFNGGAAANLGRVVQVESSSIA
jgi:pentatricopeptide repeat protein